MHAGRGRMSRSIFTAKAKEERMKQAKQAKAWEGRCNGRVSWDSGNVNGNYGFSLGEKRVNEIWSLTTSLSSTPSLSASLTALQPHGPLLLLLHAKDFLLLGPFIRSPGNSFPPEGHRATSCTSFQSQAVSSQQPFLSIISKSVMSSSRTLFSYILIQITYHYLEFYSAINLVVLRAIVRALPLWILKRQHLCWFHSLLYFSFRKHCLGHKSHSVYAEWRINEFSRHQL